MTTTRSSCLRAVSWCALGLWLTAACAAAGRAPRAPRPLRVPRAAGAAEAGAADRSLHIRSIPALSGYTSNLYEVHMQPYHFEVPALTAVATLAAAGEAEAGGVLMLWQPHPPLGPLVVAGNLTGLPAGANLLLQVKRWGDTREGCDTGTGPPYDPYGPALFPAAFPGLPPPPPPPPRFLGDVGVVEVAEDGGARVHMATHALGLSGAHSVLGRALALRTLPPPPPPPGDKGSDGGAAADAQMADDKMETIACGVIALTKYQPLPPPPPPPTPPPPPKNPEAESVETESLNRP